MKMPGDILPVMLTSGVGIGVLAGVVSGVCFLIINGVQRAKRVSKYNKQLKAESDSKICCSSCESEASSSCSLCALPICSVCCQERNGTSVCNPCISDRFIITKEIDVGNTLFKNIKDTLLFGHWSIFDTNLNRFRGTRAVSNSGESPEKNDPDREKLEENRKTRELLQRLSERLVGGSLDEVTVGKMYHHPEYLPKTDVDTVSGSHVKLQQLVQRVIEEALKLPALLDYSGIPRNPDGSLPEFNPKTYEDLLATAILNKVIDRYQNDVKRGNGASSSGVHSGSSSPGDSGRARRRRQQKRDSHHQERSRSPSPSPEPSSLESMSHDDYAHTDSSGHVSDARPKPRERTAERSVYTTDDDDEHYKKYYNNPVDGALSNMNFSHKNRIVFPEYGGEIVEVTDDLYNSNDDYKIPNGNLSTSIHANNNSWEENWLFQKKRMKSSQSVPVPMLIPNSNTEYRAMIGDRDAEDTTDLSDAGSETDETPSDIKHVLVNSKTIIGGKNPEIVLAIVNPEDAAKESLKEEPDVNCLNGDDDSTKTKDNNQISVLPDLIEENNNNLILESRERKVSTDDEVKPEIKPKDTVQKTTLKSFLKSLSSDTEGDYSGTENYYGKSSSMLEEDDFSRKNIAEATNLDVVDSKDVNNELPENLQKEGEYTETVTIPVQRHMDSLRRHYHTPIKEVKEDVIDEDSEPPPLPSTPMPIMNGKDQKSQGDIIFNFPTENGVYKNHEFEPENITNGHDVIMENSEEELLEEKVPISSIAEREHKKWLNAVPMANNPYSPEAIQSRLNKPKQSPIFDIVTNTPTKEEKTNKMQNVFSENVQNYKRYGRDYYINDAKRSTGSRKKNDTKTVSSQDVQTDIKNVTPVTRDDFAPIQNGKKPDRSVSPNVQDYNDIYSATPVIIEDVDNEFDELYKKASKHDSDDHIIYSLPVDLNDENVKKLLQMTNGIILHDSHDQSDSISSLDDCPRIYNIGTGQIIKDTKTKLLNQNSEVKKDEENEKDPVDDEILTLPSVKEIAKKFFAQDKTDDKPHKPKRRISKELLENEIVSKTLSNTNPAPKQPLHMHSLTARSISREFREELKLSMSAVRNGHPVGIKNLTNGTAALKEDTPENDSEQQVPTPGSLKNKLAFFENIGKQ